MAEVIHHVDQEFWQPPLTVQALSEPQEAPAPVQDAACQHCGTEFLLGARFCHTCGTPRMSPSPRPATASGSAYLSADLISGAAKLRSLVKEVAWPKLSFPAWFQYMQFHQIKRWLALPTPSLIAFLIGMGCVAGAIGVSLVYKAQNFVDFQAIQMWRIEWLLAATAAFVVGILFKIPSGKDRE